MSLTFSDAMTEIEKPHLNAQHKGREIIRLDGRIIGDITPNALGAGGFVHCFGPSVPPRLSARTWPQWARTRDDAHELVREAAE